MTYDDDEIIQQQAERIEELESELVQLYDELHHKKKHKEKHDLVEPEKETARPADAPSPFLHPVRLVWWHLFWPEDLRQYYSPRIRAKMIQDKWKVTAFLNYFPLLIATFGYMLGASIAPLPSPVRFGVGLCFIPVLFLGWFMTVELNRVEDKKRAYTASFMTSLIFILFILMSPIVNAPESLSTWGLTVTILLILIGTANAGLLEGTVSSLSRSRPNQNESTITYTRVVHITYTIIFLGLIGLLSAFSIEEERELLAQAYVLFLAFLAPLFSPFAFIVIYGLGLFFTFDELVWKRQEGEYLSTTFFRRFAQLVQLGLLGVIYIGFVLTTLIAILD